MSYFYSKLLKLGICRRCILRYLAVRETSLYEHDICKDTTVNYNGAELVIKGTYNEDGESIIKKTKTNACSACLGLLEDLVEDDALSVICKQVIAEKYDAPMITCAVSLPIAIQLRSHAIAIYLQLEDGIFNPRQVVPLKEAWKWTCSQRIAAGVGKVACSGAICDFLVNINLEYVDEKNECVLLEEIHGDKFDERRRNERKYRGQLFTRQGVESLLANTTPQKFQEFYSCPPAIPTTTVTYTEISCSHNALFVAGRYNKFSRELSQTPWVVEGERRMEGSVQELISNSLEKCIGSRASKFLASGREDVDVRTLGRGRPFAVELPNPHHSQVTPEELATLQEDINKNSKNLVIVRDLQVVNKDELSQLKDGEEKKFKDYVAFCVCLEGTLDSEKLKSLSSIKNLELSQKTPVRVLHRRPLATRTRTVIKMSAEKVDERHFKLYLRTQAGTYVKEFVHGDFGRTQPNLGVLLGVPVDILALDVQEVDLDWPKPILDTAGLKNSGGITEVHVT